MTVEGMTSQQRARTEQTPSTAEERTRGWGSSRRAYRDTKRKFDHSGIS